MPPPIKLVLPVPPSVNSYWEGMGKRRRKSDRAVAFIEEVSLIAALQVDEVFTEQVRVRAIVYSNRKGRDLDNFMKGLLDAMQGIVYVNDKQVIRLDAVLRHDKGNPRCVVEVRPWHDPGSEWPFES